MEFNEKIWLRAAIKGIRQIIEYKINTGEEIDFKGLVIHYCPEKFSPTRF